MGTLTVNIGFDPARIKDQRLNRLWSQDELAQAASLNVRTVQRVEAGASASLETGRALAAALDVSVNQLLSDEPDARLSRGAVGGAVSSLAGIVIGAAFASYGIYESYVSGSLTAADAGRASGIVGATTGLSLAVLGVVWGYYRVRHKHATS